MNKRKAPTTPAPTPRPYKLLTSAVLRRPNASKSMLPRMATDGIITCMPKRTSQSPGIYQSDRRLLMVREVSAERRK